MRVVYVLIRDYYKVCEIIEAIITVTRGVGTGKKKKTVQVVW